MKLRIIIFLALFSFMTPQAFALSVTCSLFPVYDFAREIAGNLAEVKLLLKPGVEPHEYEPSPQDIKTLNDSDAFIFTSTSMEHWGENISRTLNHTEIINASDGIALVNGDPHIWLDMSLAQKMVMNIASGLCRADPSHAYIYTHNAEEYCRRLQELDEKFSGLSGTLVFAGEFSHSYFLRRYGLDYVSAYDGENEPSIRKLAEVLKYIRTHGTRYIFADSFGISSVTRSISEQTGAEIAIFDTAHVVSTEGKTFLSIMNDNYTNISRALND